MTTLKLFEEIKKNAGVNEESMALGKGADGARLKENQVNATDVIERAYAQYAKNKEIVKNVAYNVGAVRVAGNIIKKLNNPQLARLLKKADAVTSAYDAYRKEKVSAAQIK